MNDRGFKVRVFFSTLAMTLAGVLPAAGCTGSCAGSCFQCAGVGGVMATVAIIAAVKKREAKQRIAKCIGFSPPMFGNRRDPGAPSGR